MCALAAGRFLDSGGVYKLAFGPKAFIVVSDPVVVRHLLKVRVACAAACPPLRLCWSSTDLARTVRHRRNFTTNVVIVYHCPGVKPV